MNNNKISSKKDILRSYKDNLSRARQARGKALLRSSKWIGIRIYRASPRELNCKRPSPQVGFLLGGFQAKNPDKQDPPWKMGLFSWGVLLTRVLRLETTQHRNPPGRGWFLTINVYQDIYWYGYRLGVWHIRMPIEFDISLCLSTCNFALLMMCHERYICIPIDWSFKPLLCRRAR